MTDSMADIVRAAKQLVDTDLAFGGDFLPAKRNPLPPMRSTGILPVSSAGVSPALDAMATSVAAMPPQSTGQPPIGATMTPQQKQSALDELREKCVAHCGKCVLANTVTNVVFGEGNPAAELMFVGEGPGAEEDATGRPFVGRAGELLTKMIIAMGLSRADVYIANMVKCRPPENRTPEPAEVVACMPYLVAQMQIIAPKVIVTLGNPATQGLLRTSIGITKLRGQWQKLPNIGEGLEDIPVMPTFHPAYVLRNYNEQTRGLVWDDLKKVLTFLGRQLPGEKKT